MVGNPRCECPPGWTRAPGRTPASGGGGGVELRLPRLGQSPPVLAASVAPARPHHHVLVFLQYDVGVVVEVQDGDGVEFGGGAARLWDVLGVHQVDLKNKDHRKRLKTGGY